MTLYPVLSAANGLHDKIICEGHLWSFLQGELDPAEELLVAAHCQLSCAAHKRLQALAICASSVMQEMAPQAMRCSAQAFFAEKCIGSSAPPAPEMVCVCDVPKALHHLIGTSFDDVAWKTIYPGIQEKKLRIEGSVMQTRLLNIKGGTTVPKHSHPGSEVILILQGAFCDEGQSYTIGEVSIHQADAKHSHAPQATADCICLAVTSAPIRLQGFLGRILRPFQALLS